MADIANMVLDGTLCESCGVLVDGQGAGYPRRCEGCAGDLEEYMSDDDAEFPEWLEAFLDDATEAIVNNSPLPDALNVVTRELKSVDDLTAQASYEVRIYPNLIPTDDHRMVPPCMHVNVMQLADMFDGLTDIEWHPCTGSVAISGAVKGHEVLMEIFDDLPDTDEDEDEPDEAHRNDLGSN